KSTKLPVTVKTRLGWDDEHKNILEVAERLQDVGIQALTVHGRTRTQMYKGEADWRLIAEVKNNQRIHIPIFGNGDVDTPQKALEYKNRFGVDGIMIGRGAIGYPWIFNEIKHFFKTGEESPAPTIADRVAVCKKHLLRSIEWKNNVVGVLEMRRHYSHYFRGLPHFKDYRMKLVTMDDFNEIMILLDEIALHYSEVGVVN
ncbi:MAG: tRNA-dihydrouridine synthase, partial [Bacteroidota bacterium]